MPTPVSRPTLAAAPATSRASASTLVVVSHYNAWPVDQLVALLDQMAAIPAGASFDVCVVVNQARPERLALPERHAGVVVLYRENTGFNVGAWDHGWRADPGRPCYLFLQEECRILRPGWLDAFRRLAMRPDVGLVGESLHWGGASWDRLTRQYRDVRFWASIEGEPVSVTEGVRAGLARLGVPEGRTGAHLQSLVLCARGDVLAAINGLPTGVNYDAATIAEVALSKKVSALGLTVREVGPGSFRYILHPQWQRRQGIGRSWLRAVLGSAPVGFKERMRAAIRRH